MAGGRSLSWQLRAQGRTPPWTGCPSLPHSHPHSLSLGQCRHSSSPNVHTFVIWEDSRVPGENPRRRGEDMQTPHRHGPGPEVIFSPHQCYNETMLSKTMLFKDQLYFGKSNIDVSFQVEHVYPCQIIIFLLLAFENSRS